MPIPSFTPAFVISVNWTRSSFSSGTSLARWAAIASPSRSGSLAIYTRSADALFFLNSLTKSLRFGSISSVISKSFSISIPSLFDGRSLTWPTHAITSNSPSRYCSIVLALDGDSTTIKDF